MYMYAHTWQHFTRITFTAKVKSTKIWHYQGRIESPKAVRGHATHIDGIVLNVTKFRIQILCSLHCIKRGLPELRMHESRPRQAGFIAGR